MLKLSCSGAPSLRDDGLLRFCIGGVDHSSINSHGERQTGALFELVA
jgi:hypothetical protein